MQLAEHPDYFTPRQTLTAWSVHLLTASGLLLALLMLQAANDGRWQVFFLFMALSILIDGFDGLLARKARVKEILPGIDGMLLDNIVDFVTYAVVPAYVALTTDLLPGPWAAPIAVIILLTSAYQFSQSDAKTDDHFYKGFPSYWNITVYYMFLLGWSPGFNLAFLLALSVLVFVPIKFIYPSRTIALRTLTWTLLLAWMVAHAVLLARFNDPPLWLAWGSLSFVVYYVGASLWLMVRRRRAA
jgi:phosphatidylcholine synthase